MLTYHLNPAEKRQRVTRWLRRRTRPRPDGDLAGRGWPDPDVFELTDRLNALEGVCTMQSCSGHPQQEVAPGAWSVFVGFLWLRLSEAMFTAFIERAPHLAADPNVEQVGVMWGAEATRPVVQILFHGLDKDEETFQLTSDVIVGFFEGLRP